MAFWLGIPLAIRLGLLFMLGTLVGGQVNRGIYRLAWTPRRIGPWSAPHEKAPPRHWSDRIPIFGWWKLQREAKLHGRGYWIRPLLIELALGFFFAWLYRWEIHGRLFPVGLALPMAEIHAQFLSHVILVSLMLVATFIDFDEQTIPDAITVPGMLLGLVLAAGLPSSRLPTLEMAPGMAMPQLVGLHLASPDAWPARLGEEPRWLLVALGLYYGWCLAVTPGVWSARHGVVKAFRYWFVSIFRHGTVWRFALLAALGTLLIAPVWFLGGLRWEALFSSLTGMAFGGGLVWAVRIVAGASLGKEAMGFGDVTLMAMIGAFVGWQPSLYIFFLAPFLGIVIAVVQWLLTRRPDIAYGPYLCAAATCAIIFWEDIWFAWLAPIFALGWYIPIALIACLALMGLMLFGLQLLKSLFLREEPA